MRSNYSYLFLLTYGRTGSTVLMKLLNQQPDIHMTGENGNALFHLFRAVQGLETAAGKVEQGDTVDNPWYGASQIDRAGFRDAVLDSFVRDVFRPPPGVQRIGFKEVRHLPRLMSDGEFKDYVAFLLTEFPDARIVFNMRDWSAVAKSAWNTKQSEEDVRDRVEATDARFRKAHERWPDRTILFDYADLKPGNPRLRAVLDFAGAPLSDAEVTGVLNKPLTHLKSEASLHQRAFRKLKRLISSG